MSFSNAGGYDRTKSTLHPVQGSSEDTLSCSTPDAKSWQIISASVLGAFHKSHGERNQDALSWWSAEGEQPLAVLCVADGHGGSEYTRSHIGAHYAVEQTQQLLVRELLPRILDGSALADLARFGQQLDQQLEKELVKRWRNSIEKHKDHTPILEKEKLAWSDSQPERHYGTTLLTALLTPELHLYIQLGDGDILTISSDGEVIRPPFEEDSHLFANHTTSLCSMEAWRFVRVHFQPILEKPPVLVMLATDGYANSFADDAGFEQVARDLYAAIQQDGPSVVASHLPDWLEATSKVGSGDDISVVIAANLSRWEYPFEADRYTSSSESSIEK